MNTYKNNKRARNKQHGFTLIEMAIVMMVLGLFATVVTTSYTLRMKIEREETTQVNTERIAQEMGNFRRINGRYPRPASRAAIPGDADYGREYMFGTNSITEADTGNGGAGNALTALVTAAAAQGCLPNNNPGDICWHESSRDNVDHDLNPATPTVNPRVLVGSVPFKELGIPEDLAYDGYGNRLTYVVTLNLTDSSIFENQNGGIGIIDGDNNSLLAEENSGHFLVFSHGYNGYGAISRNGVEQPCPPYLNGDTANVLDCALTLGTPMDAIYTYDHGDISGNDEYDDYMMYASRASMGHWQLSEDNGDDGHLIRDDAKLTVNAPEADTTNPDDRLVVNNGDMRIDDKIKLDDDNAYCNEAGDPDNCFKSALIAGDPDAGTGGMACPPGSYMTGIKNNAPICEQEVFSTCPTGKKMSGLSSNGEILCDDLGPAGCEPIDVTDCGETYSLPAASNNKNKNIKFGDNKWHKYRCRNEAWQRVKNWGYCSCEDELLRRYRGNVTRTKNYCDQLNGNVSGANPYSGNVDIIQTYYCQPNGKIGTQTTQDSGTCACNNITDTRSLNCSSAKGAGYSGKYTRTRTFDCAAGKWGAFSYDYSSCVCNAGSTDLSDRNCKGTGMTGKIKRTQVTTCPDGKTTITEDTSACRCEESFTYIDTCPGSPTHQGHTWSKKGIQCGSDLSQPGTYRTLPLDSSDPASYRNADACEPCPPPTFTWKFSDGPTSTGNSVKRSIRMNYSSCTASEAGKTAQCYNNGPGGTYDYYLCVCQQTGGGCQ